MPLPPTCMIDYVDINHDYVCMQMNYVNIQHNYVIIGDNDINPQLNNVACQYYCVAS